MLRWISILQALPMPGPFLFCWFGKVHLEQPTVAGCAWLPGTNQLHVLPL